MENLPPVLKTQGWQPKANMVNCKIGDLIQTMTFAYGLTASSNKFWELDQEYYDYIHSNEWKTRDTEYFRILVPVLPEATKAGAL